jgi:predicted transposase YbfD/YdcC
MRLDWGELNKVIAVHFGAQVELGANHDWVAIDGKTLRGTLGEKQAMVFAVSHKRRTLLAQKPMEGSKASEIAVVRTLLQESGLEAHKVTLDAHHCNPTTTAQIHQGGGQYVIQVKQNQPILFKQCQDLAATARPRIGHTESEKGHGRLTTRQGQCFAMAGVPLATRWRASGLHTLVVMQRETTTLTTQKTTSETAYYISNQELSGHLQAQAQELTGAIRQHWHVESDNWIRDVTFDEDHVKTKAANQAQVMSCLRSLALHLLLRLSFLIDML